jgi:hypothetical protein
MLYINANEEKYLSFDVEIQGVDIKEMKAAVRLEIGGVEYGFPAEVEHKKISALVPPLIEVCGKDLEDGTVVNAKLEVFTERHYFKPWEGDIKVGAPMAVKAQIKEEKQPTVKTKIQNVIEEKKEETKPDDIKQIIKQTLSEMLHEKTTPKQEVVVPKKPERKPIIKENSLTLDKLTKEHLFRFMEIRGTKNKEIQETIYNNVVKTVGSEEPKKLFEYLVKYYKRKK